MPAWHLELHYRLLPFLFRVGFGCVGFCGGLFGFVSSPSLQPGWQLSLLDQGDLCTTCTHSASTRAKKKQPSVAGRRRAAFSTCCVRWCSKAALGIPISDKSLALA